ncbi:MAG: double zinc ribbon domain-containing protein [Gemmatimonadota bacterium]
MRVSTLLDLVLAPVCLACDDAIAIGDDARLICRRCRSRLRDLPQPACLRCGAPLPRTGAAASAVCNECARWPAALRFARSACLLWPPADRMVHQLKYGGWRALATPMAERMRRIALPEEITTEVRMVVPVPTTAARRRARGYNQAELIAREYARLIRVPCIPVLERTRASDSQTALQPLARAANVASAFQLTATPPRLEGAHLLLIDDVLTTGATAAECALTLVAGGVRAVSVLTFARALDARRLTGG